MISGLFMGAMALLIRLYGMFVRCADYLQSPLLLAFRVNWGAQFFSTGLGKLQNHERVVGFFTDLGIPMPGLNAWFVGGVECIGGALLLIGLAARPTAAVLSINMLVAYVSVADDRAALFGVFSDPAPFLAADPFFFLLTSLLILAFGPGLLAVDTLVRKWVAPSAMSSKGEIA